MKTYCNKGGLHVCLDGRRVPPGGVVETDEDLHAKFPHKFIVQAEEPQAVPREEVAVAAATKEDTAHKPATPDSGVVDVTPDFPTAAAAGLVVRCDKRGWWVFDGGGEAANEDVLKRKDVLPFLNKYLAEE